MNMPFRLGRNLALVVLVGVFAPLSADASDHGGPLMNAAKATSGASATSKRIHIAPAMPQYWSTQGAAEVLISDADPHGAAPGAAAAATTSLPSVVPPIGWRSPRQASDNKIKFTDTARLPESNAAVASAVPAAAAVGIELKLNEAGIAAQKAVQQAATPKAEIAPQPAPAIQAAPIAVVAPVAAPIEQAATAPASAVEATPAGATASAIATAIIEPQSPLENKIQLVATQIQDSKVRPAEGAEPLPTPYSTDTSMRVSDGEMSEYIDGCCPSPPPLFWTAGVEATFLSPDLNTFGTGVSIEEFEYNRLDSASSFNDDVDSVYLAPRIWIGVQGCKWGANLRYWHLQAGESSYDPPFGSHGDWDGPGSGIPNFGFDSHNHLEAYTVDLEITRRLAVHDLWMQFSAGVRHAEIWQDEGVTASGVTDDSMMFAFGQANRNTRGTGLVFGWYGRKPLYPCSCVHWFYNLRFSTLWGPTETYAETGVLVGAVTPEAVAAAGSVNGASTYVDDNLFIGEVQLGLEWDYALRCLPANAFFRTAIEYQRWTGGQGYSAANSFAGVVVDDGINPSVQAAEGTAFAAADAPELELIGLSIGTGLTW